MTIILIGCIIIIIICVLLIGYMVIYNKFQEFIIRINEAEVEIDTILRKRFDLLNKSISIIKANTNTEDDVLELIVKLRSRKLTNFELDRNLYDAINEFNQYSDKYPELKESDNFIKIELGLSESEAEIMACRKYYNDIITDYNRMVRSLPSSIIAKLAKFKEKNYFDGRDRNDDILNDFKL